MINDICYYISIYKISKQYMYIYNISEIFISDIITEKNMEEFIYDGEKDLTEEQLLDADGLDDAEEGFMRGYSHDEEVEECKECGSVLFDDKKVYREINGEKHSFCSSDCADDFEETSG